MATLAEYLEATGRTKQDLADAVGVKWQSIHLISTGRQVPRLRTALRIQEATKGLVTVEDLVRRQETGDEAAE